MENIQLIVSLMFYSVASIYLIFSIYTILSGKKSLPSKLLFFLCITSFIWSFSFALATHAESYETALFWRRVSSFGWGAFYAILLHFMLAVSNRSCKYTYILQYLIYIPAVITVYVFGLNGSLAANI